MFCHNCGAQMPDHSKFCTTCGTKLASEPLNLSDNQPSSQPTNQPHQLPLTQPITGNGQAYKQPKPKKKKSCLFRFSVLALVLVFALILFSRLFSVNDQPITLGKTKDEVRVDVPVNGGVVKVEDSNSPINGFTIQINSHTYDTQKTFDIKTTEIKNHQLGNDFTPITPLISVDNGHAFANRPMQVTIPINIAEDEFAMGFYYNQTAGELEALPFERYDATQITLITHHFSDILVSKISISELEKLTTTGNPALDTGFMPGVDDWQFVNYGSALAPGGHCAGQSLTMAWYYGEKHVKNSEQSLFGRFDNNGGAKTNDFWQDDSDSYRFASVTQDSANWNGQEFFDYLNFSSQNQRRVFYAFAYAMKITNQPQFMGIYRYNDQGQCLGGHAIVAYKIENGRIYVADPNYPGQQDRYCELNGNGFNPYSSGANAAAINDSGAVLYTEMHFIATSALINFDDIAANYKKMLDGTIGDDAFPDTTVDVLSTYHADMTQMGWSNSDTPVYLDQSYADSLPNEMKNQTLIKVTPHAPGLVYSLYLNNQTEPEQNPVIEVLDGHIYFEINLMPGQNDVALLVEQEIDGRYSYVDFIRIPIHFINKPLTPTPTDEPDEDDDKNDKKAINPNQMVKIICAFNDNYNYNVDLVTKEYKVGDPFPYDFLEKQTTQESGHKFGGYFLDEACTQPLTYTTVPAEDVMVYALWTKLTLDEMLGRYDILRLEDYLDYEYYIFEPGNTLKHIYKYKDKPDVITVNGTWSLRETPYKKYGVTSLDATEESSSFPLSFVVYEDRVRESSGKIYMKQ